MILFLILARRRAAARKLKQMTKESKSDEDNNDDNDDDLLSEINIGKIRSRYCKSFYANTPMQYTAIFHGCKNVNYQMKNCGIFLIFAQNIDRGYTLEPPQ